MSRFVFTKVVVGVAVAWISASAVNATRQPSDRVPQAVASSPFYFSNMDANHDGFISRSEVPRQLNDLRTHFDEYASDDHRISEQEYAWYLQTITSGPCRHGKMLANAGCGQDPYAMTEGP